MAYQPKSYKKFVATAATATLVASAFAPFASAADASKFTDVSAKYKDAVAFVVEKGANGTSETTFGTEANIKRVDAAVLLVNVLGLDIESAPDSGLTDVPQRAVKHINALKEAGITSGKTETTFDPDAQITRGELAIWISKAFGLEGSGDVDFKDVSSSYKNAVSALVEAGITSGTSETTFGTTANAKRGDYAIFLYKAAEQATPKAAVTAVKAENGKVTVTLDNALESVKASDFKLTQSIDGKEATAVTATEAKLSEDKKSVELTVPAVAQTENEQSVVVTAAYKTGKAVTAEAFKVEATVAKVTSVTAINATQVEVKFSKAVSKSSVIAATTSGAEVAGTLVNGVFAFSSLDGKPAVDADGSKATLSEDGKTLTITSGVTFEGRYDVSVAGALDKDGKSVIKFKQVLDFGKDTVAPTILKTEKVTANLVKVTFSEPIHSVGTATFKLEDGSVVTGITESPAFVSGDSSVTFDLTNAQAKGAALATGVNVIGTFVGVQDKNLNLLNPNPATVTFSKGAKDGVAPTVSAVTQTGAKEFTVKFSEVLTANPTIKVNGSAVASITQDSTDKTKYVLTTSATLDGATTVTVDAGYTDLSGETGAAFSKVYSFVKDVVAAKVTKTAVVQDATDGKQYLEVTFDKNVDLASTSTLTVTGTHAKDFVTVNVSKTAAVGYKSATDKKVIRVALSTLLDSTTPNAAYKLGAIYDLDVKFADVTSETGVAVDSTTADFTLAADGTPSASGKVTVASVGQGTSNDVVTVTFNDNVDLATATNAANYTVDGAVVESATASQATTKVITLKLKANSNTFTGIRNVTVKNVKNLDGTVAMDTQTVVSSSLNENVLPTVTSAKLTAVNTIEVTFSENVSNGAAADFVLYVGGVAVSNSVTTATQATATDNVLELTLGTNVTAAELTKGLSLNAASSVDIVDSVGNKLTVPTAITVAQ